MFFGGIEGGASCSQVVIIDGKGHTLASVRGPSTNHLYLERTKFLLVIKQLVDTAKAQASLPLDKPLDALGLCLSGQSYESNEELAAELVESFPNVTRHCQVANDCIGTMYTVPFESGIVLIAGTGSSSIYFDKTGPLYTCGGWGHLFDDEGSGYFISKRAYKMLLDSCENYEQFKFDLTRLRKVVCKYIGSDDFRSNIIDFLYTKIFDKKKFAKLCEFLAQEVSEESDEAIDSIFEDAGERLGKMVVALSRQTHAKKPIKVICTGSVFKSWNLLVRGVLRVLNRNDFEFHLVNGTSAFGAAKFAANKSLNIDTINLDVGTRKLGYAL